MVGVRQTPSLRAHVPRLAPPTGALTLIGGSPPTSRPARGSLTVGLAGIHRRTSLSVLAGASSRYALDLVGVVAVMAGRPPVRLELAQSAPAWATARAIADALGVKLVELAAAVEAQGRPQR
jgi:hypothetical protein